MHFATHALYNMYTLKVDGWKEVLIVNGGTDVNEIKEIFEGEKEIELKEKERYLGEILSSDGRNLNKAFIGLGSCDNIQTERSIFEYANWPRLEVKRTGPSSWSFQLICPADPSS